MKYLHHLWQSEEWRFSLVIFLLFRFGIWGWMVLVRRFIPMGNSIDENAHPYLGILPERNPFLEVWQRWDVLHYQQITVNGYRAASIEPFGPLYPFLIRWSSLLTGGNTLLAGLLISSLFCLFAIYAFITLARAELGNRVLSQHALLYLVCFPTAFFLFAPYTESIFLLGAVMSMKSMRQKQWIAAGLWGMLAASVRLPAALLLLPAVYEAWMEWSGSKRVFAWISPFLILTGAWIFPVYLWLEFKLPFWAILKSLDTGYQRSFSFPGLNLWYSIQNIIRNIHPLVNVPDLICMLLFLAGAVLVWKKLPVVYTIYTAAFLALYLSTTTSPYPLLSISRYVLVLFPVFLVMPTFVKSRRCFLAILAVLFAGLLFYSAQFAIWGWVG